MHTRKAITTLVLTGSLVLGAPAASYAVARTGVTQSQSQNQVQHRSAAIGDSHRTTATTTTTDAAAQHINKLKKKKKKKKSSGIGWIVILLIVIIIAAVIVYAISRSRKRD
ncbi:hypothetical protein [Streptomyces sp. NPDC050738]|uniref:hypothetical protein n=1 Tax=Streptomyces sp. NPDC050738 TaxID=3154744 RepID=UPI0034402451